MLSNMVKNDKWRIRKKNMLRITCVFTTKTPRSKHIIITYAKVLKFSYQKMRIMLTSKQIVTNLLASFL